MYFFGFWGNIKQFLKIVQNNKALNIKLDY